MNRTLIAAAFFAATLAHAGGLFAPGAAQGALQGQANAQWMQMSQAWTNCMNQGGGSSCGPAPQPPQQMQQQQEQPKQTDFRCVQACTSQGNQYGLCMS